MRPVFSFPLPLVVHMTLAKSIWYLYSIYLVGIIKSYSSYWIMEALELHEFKVAIVQNIYVHIQTLKLKVNSEGIWTNSYFL